ncbi:MAG: hypothetical protein IID58_04695 [Proteobacteria bacterium]|nr:hypothetical protein [Pseudomonadota bacterium]
MTILGLVTILTMQADPMMQLPGCVLWLLFSGRELVAIASGYQRIRRIRLYSNGDVELGNDNGDWQSARLANGSVVLDGFAWLRFEACDGRRSVELLRGTSRKNEEWRRLQVIWRHLGAAVGS